MARVKQLADKDGEPIYPVVDPTQLHFSGTEKQAVKGDGTIGVPQYVKQLEGNGRIASADIAHQYDNDQVHQRLDISSSSMTTGKPAADGFINTYMWDNSGTYDTQVYIPNGETVNNGGMPQIRFRGGNANWGSWKNIITSNSTNSVTSGMIDWNGMKPVWSTFVRTSAADGDTSFTSKLGTQFNVRCGNGGTCMAVRSNARNIKMFRQTICATFSSSMTGTIGAHNGSNGNTYSYYVGALNNTYVNTYNSYPRSGNDEGTYYYGNAIATSGTCYALMISFTGARVSNTKWFLQGQFQYSGSQNAINFTIEMDAANENTLPTLYKRGAGASNTTWVCNTLEILET